MVILTQLIPGIGIDDMFVIVQCLNNVKRSGDDQTRSVSQVVSETMRHAGVSITVTSITDILAFGVGYFTVSNKTLFQNCDERLCSEHSWIAVVLCVCLHRTGLHLPTPDLLVCRLDGPG